LQVSFRVGAHPLLEDEKPNALVRNRLPLLRRLAQAAACYEPTFETAPIQTGGHVHMAALLMHARLGLTAGKCYLSHLPARWWTAELDRRLLMSVYRHGFRWSVIQVRCHVFP
jgi:hypothetical protein